MVVQLIAAIAYVMVVLLVLDLSARSYLIWAVGASSLASSAYLVFALPFGHASAAKRIAGGYVVAIICGVLVRICAMWFFRFQGHSAHIVVDISSDEHMYWLIGAVAVGLSMFFMVIFDFEHPPAAGLSLALVIEMHEYFTIMVILGLALLLSVIKITFKRVLRNLN